MKDVDLQRAHDRFSDPAGQAAWAALPMPLREFGEIAGPRLSQILADALRHATQLLFSEGARALTPHEREAMLEAADFTRKHKDSLIAAFLAHFEQRYVRACQYKPSLMTAFRIDFDARDLQIVNHDLLDDSLEPGLLAQDIQNSCWVSLHVLTRHFGRLLGAEAISPNEMPLSPRLIEAALSDAVRTQSGRHDAKFRLVRCLRKYLPVRIDTLYCDLAELMDTAPRRPAAESAALAAEPAAAAPDRPGPGLVAQTRTDKHADTNTHTDLLADALALAAERNKAAHPQITAAAAPGHRKADPETVSPQRSKPPAAVGASHKAEAGPAPAAPGVQRGVQAGKSQSNSNVAAVCPPAARPSTATSLPQDVAPVSTRAAERVEQELPGNVLAGLKNGAWLALRDAKGDWQELKLAWISPHRSLFILTNRRGERAHSLVAADLAAALRDGRARLVRPCEADSSAIPGRIDKKTA